VSDPAIVATSREPLGVAGEVLFRLAPLDVGSVAVTLFRERARSVSRGFDIDSETEDVVRQLCRRLDGLPLAIELAAARVSMLSPAEILVSLDETLSQLRQRARGVPNRQRTMEATLEWSWQLLDTTERAALARLSLFADGFDQAAARSAISFGSLTDADVTELLISFIDKSLVIVDPVNHHRARLLETVRAYARARLRESGDLANAARAIADYYLGQFGPDRDACDAAAISAGSAELENIGALIEVVRDIDIERAQTVAYVLIRLLRTVDARRARAEGLAALAQLAAATPARVGLLGYTAAIAADGGQIGVARELLDEAAALRASVGGEPAWAECFIEQQRAVLAILESRADSALEIANAALARASTARGRRGALNVKLIAESDLGLFDEARLTSEQCLACARDIGDDEILSHELSNAAELTFRAGDMQASARFQREGLALALQLGSVVQIAFAISLAARLAAQQDNWSTAVELQTAGDALLDTVGVELYPSDADIRDALLREAATQFAPEQLAAHIHRGENADITALADDAAAIFDAAVRRPT
jgi:predicted ATPase